MKRFLFLLLLLSPLLNSAQDSGVLITNVTLHTGTGTAIEYGAIGMRNGKIDYVGKVAGAVQANYTEVIDGKGGDVYPGLIAMNTSLGLNEIFAVRATNDYRETGSYKPNVRSIIAYNAESQIVETSLANGVVMAQVCPRGGVIKGSSSLVKLDAWNWEDAAVRMDEGIHMDWPRMVKRSKEPNTANVWIPDEEFDAKIEEIRTFFENARSYSNRSTTIDRDVRFEAMRGLFSGEKRLYISANNIKEIRGVIGFKRDMDIDKVTIVGGNDAWMASDLLRENDISVLVGRVHRLPKYAEDPVDAPFSLPAKLSKAGVKFSFELNGDMEPIQNRNLPFNIGTAIAYGLDYEKAVKAATLTAAEILGVSDRTGSLQVGKDANVIWSSGDLFDMRTSLIQGVWLDGKLCDITTRQEELYQKYKNKYGL